MYLREHKYNHYLYHYDFISEMCDTNRAKLIEDIGIFIETYYPEVDSSKYCSIFDMYYYNPQIQYPITINGYEVDHAGLGDMNNFASFVGLTRKKQGWRCKVKKI